MSAEVFGPVLATYVSGAVITFMVMMMAELDGSFEELLFVILLWPVALITTLVRGGMEFLSR